MKDRFVQQVAVFNVIVAPCDAVPGQVATAVFERWDKGIHTNPTRREYALTNERAGRLTKVMYHMVRVPGRFRPFLALGFGWVWERTR